MRDRVCPIGDCTSTIRFERAVVEVTPRFRLHDLDDVDEFAVCPTCEAEIAGYYGDDPAGAADGEGGVEVILDIDDDGGSASGAGRDTGEGGGANADAPTDGGGETDDVTDGEDVDGGGTDVDGGGTDVTDGDDVDGDDDATDGEDDHERIFTQSTDDFDDPEAVLDAAHDEDESGSTGE